MRLTHEAGAHLICKPNFADLRRFALDARAIAGAHCGEAASSFSLPARGMIVGVTWCNAGLDGMTCALQMARGLQHAYDGTHGAAAHDHAAAERRSQMALRSIPAAETS